MIDLMNNFIQAQAVQYSFVTYFQILIINSVSVLFTINIMFQLVIVGMYTMY